MIKITDDISWSVSGMMKMWEIKGLFPQRMVVASYVQKATKRGGEQIMIMHL